MMTDGQFYFWLIIIAIGVAIMIAAGMAH